MATSRANDEAKEADLLPGLPNDLTLERILGTLPWQVAMGLASVNKTWLHSIRSRNFYDVRVRSHSTDTFLLVARGLRQHCLRDEGGLNKSPSWLGLVSMKDDFVHELPPIPFLSQGSWECVPLQGKIYVLGGPSLNNYSYSFSNKVYVLDLAAGQIQWKECASMIDARVGFGCGVMNGKLYVFGGTYGKSVWASEVYDPAKDIWTPIRQKPSSRFGQRVDVVGEEFFVTTETVIRISATGAPILSSSEPNDLLVYRPLKDEWTVVNLLPRYCDKMYFTTRGKFYCFASNSIDVYDCKDNSWTQLHSPLFEPIDSLAKISFPMMRHMYHGRPVYMRSVVAVSDEILALVHFYVGDELKHCLLQSRGFGRKDRKIAWEKPPVDVTRVAGSMEFQTVQLHTIQL